MGGVTDERRDGGDRRKAPAYLHYAQDWIAGTAHLCLEAQGAFIRLLDHQWVDGPFANDPDEIAGRLGISPRRFAKVWQKLARHFPKNSTGLLANRRLEDERAKQIAYRAEQSRRGHAGANARWGNGE